jgi:hypothetical protein
MSSRSLVRFKERSKKALLARYFNHKQHEGALCLLGRNSTRGKVVRRLASFLKKHHNACYKQDAMNLEAAVRKQSTNKEQYMQSIISLFN